MIAGRAVGSDEGYIYVRAEYPLAVSRLKAAIAKAEGVRSSGRSRHGHRLLLPDPCKHGRRRLRLRRGQCPDSFHRGQPGHASGQAPRTIEHGLWAEPTVLNNVGDFANVPLIIRKGVDWYRSIGTKTSPGTKAFALTGNVVNTGLIEVPMGTTIREVVFDIGGGIRGGKKFKAVQIGGPSGGATTASREHLDLPWTSTV